MLLEYFLGFEEKSILENVVGVFLKGIFSMGLDVTYTTYYICSREIN
jgi:hypothetical protein